MTRRAGADWAQQRERGSGFWVRFMIGLSLGVGWWPAYVLLLPITAYFFLTAPKARRASRQFLARALGREAKTPEVFRHFFSFSVAVLDRVFFLANRTQRFAVSVEGLDLLSNLLAEGRGLVLLGSHLGSFETLALVARQAPVRVRPVMYRRHSGVATRLFEALDPSRQNDIIAIGEPGAMLQVSESIARGEIVGLLADRTPGGEKTLLVPFLGSPAPFATGPFILASVVHAPVVQFFAVRTGRRRYQIRFELLATRITLDRAVRQQALSEWVGRYAGRLEAMARTHPFDWFNFFDFWGREDYESGGRAQLSAGSDALDTAASVSSMGRAGSSSGVGRPAGV